MQTTKDDHVLSHVARKDARESRRTDSLAKTKAKTEDVHVGADGRDTPGPSEFEWMPREGLALVSIDITVHRWEEAGERHSSTKSRAMPNSSCGSLVEVKITKQWPSTAVRYGLAG